MPRAAPSGLALSPPPAPLVLPNGARAILVARPQSPTFALHLLVQAGSRHDGARHGLAHLVEHLVFRAPSDSRPDLFATVERLGGEVTATTGRDHTLFSLVVAAPDATRALALLPALVRPPATDRASVRGERQIIGHELRERGRPADALWDLLLTSLWGDTPFARPPAGALATLSALTGRAASALHARYYTAPHILAIGVGAVAPQAFTDAVRAGLGPLAGQKSASSPPTPQQVPGGAAREAPATGAGNYVAVGAVVPGVEHANSAALRLLEVVLGQGAGSRLARALAARGLPAVVQTHYAAYAGVGVFAALAAGAPADPARVADALETAIRDLAAQPPAPAELRAARCQLTGALYRRCESNAGLATALGARALFADSPEGAAFPELTVAPAQVLQVAHSHLASPRFARAILRPAAG